MEHNFNQHITDGDDIGPYDFRSIMHYPTHAFSRDNIQPTIETINGEAIGQRNGLSDGDVQAINFMYPIIGWNPEWFPIPGNHTFDRERQQIAAVSRTPNNLDLFVIGKDDHVWTTFWRG